MVSKKKSDINDKSDYGDKISKIYLTTCQKYDNYLQYFCQRFSNNNKPVFTDQEVITIYLFCTGVEHKYKIKENV